MEIKTCEHYVVNRVMELDDEVERQKEYIIKQEDLIRELQAKLAFVGNFLHITKACDWNEQNKSTYIDFNTVWKKYSPKEYEQFCEIFGLVESDKEEE